MKNLRYILAECSQDCNDRQCPYSHSHGWTCDEVDGRLFSTPNDVVLSIALSQAPATDGAPFDIGAHIDTTEDL